MSDTSYELRRFFSVEAPTSEWAGDVKRQFPVPPSEQPIPVVGRETGRNQPCPCGSGKKYKKCCKRGKPT